jgi:hypothetical protein
VPVRGGAQAQAGRLRRPGRSLRWYDAGCSGYTQQEIQFEKNAHADNGIASQLSLADWEIVDWTAESWPYRPIPGGLVDAGYSLSFEARRLTGYWIYKVIMPLVLIVAMSWIVFWIDPQESGTQIGVAMTSMLTLIAYRFMVGGLLPKISYLTRLDVFILLSTLLVFATLTEVVTTTVLAKGGQLQRARRIDRWARLLFPGGFLLVIVSAFLL